MATARARKDSGRPLSEPERRWLLDQMLRRGSRTPAAAEAAAGAEEASSMIVRPAPAVPEPPPAPAPGAAAEAGAFSGPSLRGGLPASPALADPEAGAAAPAGGTAQRSPPRLAQRAASPTSREPEPGPMIPRIPTPDAHRAAPVVDIRRYRAVFACSMQARETPTERTPSA